MFSLSGGRAATLSVLYHLNSRDSLFRNTQDTSVSATAIYLQTTIEPEQMFGGGVESRSITPTGKNRILDDSEQAVLAAVDGSGLVGRGHDPRSNPAIGVKAAVRDKIRRVVIVRTSSSTRVSLTVEGGKRDEVSELPQHVDMKVQL